MDKKKGKDKVTVLEKDRPAFNEAATKVEIAVVADGSARKAWEVVARLYVAMPHPRAFWKFLREERKATLRACNSWRVAVNRAAHYVRADIDGSRLPEALYRSMAPIVGAGKGKTEVKAAIEGGNVETVKAVREKYAPAAAKRETPPELQGCILCKSGAGTLYATARGPVHETCVFSLMESVRIQKEKKKGMDQAANRPAAPAKV